MAVCLVAGGRGRCIAASCQTPPGLKRQPADSIQQHRVAHTHTHTRLKEPIVAAGSQSGWKEKHTHTSSNGVHCRGKRDKHNKERLGQREERRGPLRKQEKREWIELESER